MRYATAPILLAFGIVLAFAIAFSTLAYTSFREKSATWDEPVHLTAGVAALAQGDHRFDPEHPPFALTWAAIPLLWTPGFALDAASVAAQRPIHWARVEQFDFAHRFLYQENDADRLLYPARAMIVALGVLLAGLVFAWSYELAGLPGGCIALACFLLEPNLMAHSSLVTTDLPLTCFFFGAVYFLWRTCRRCSAANVLGLVVFFVLAMVTKYSALLLVPVLGSLLALAVFGQRRLSPAVAGGLLLALAIASWAGIWAAYHFRYAPGPSDLWHFRFQYDPVVAEEAPGLASLVAWVDANRLLPNAYTQGFLLTQVKSLSRRAFLAGAHGSTGWWHYFPLAFLVKTPVSLMLLSAGALVLALRRWLRRSMGDELYLVVPILAVFAAGVGTSLNIGHRHILAIYPFLVTAAAFVAARGLARSRVLGGAVLALLLAFWTYELSRAYPHTLAFFNTLAGGPEHGADWLVDSNLDWGQDLKPLARWLDEHEVQHVNLAYFGTADPRYYGIEATYLPGSPFFIPAEEIAKPRLPGYVAVSATILTGVYGDSEVRSFYRGLARRTPIAVIGHSIRVYWARTPWW
jgi:hypothetical protein